MNKVLSSQIDEMGFDGVIMVVKFHTGKFYRYKNVTREIFDRIINDPISVGKAFNDLIKKHPDLYPYEPI